MLICRFSGGDGPDQLMAPVARVRIVQGAIYADDEQKAAGVYRKDHWEFRGQAFTRMSVEGPLTATLRDTETGMDLHCAAYKKVWLAGGVLQAPSGTIATLDEGTQLWRDAATDRYAHEVRLELRAPRTMIKS
ncbi:MAG: hypothetical protein ACM3SS_07395 [Rhodospirillaceae bacterium]